MPTWLSTWTSATSRSPAVADLGDRHPRRSGVRLLDHRVEGGREGRDALAAQHRVLDADAQDVRELLGELIEEDVEPNQSVPAERRPRLEVDVLLRLPVLRLRHVARLLDGGDLGAQRPGQAGVAGGHVAVLARLRLGPPSRKSLKTHSG